MTLAPIAASNDTTAWWKRRRRVFNSGLLLSGLASLLLSTTIIEFKTFPPGAEVETSLVSLALQGLGYGVYLLLANLLYSLGGSIERLMSSSVVPRYRSITFPLGCAFAWFLPQLEPLSLLIRY